MMDGAVERRLYALARGGGPFVQRALSYDKAAGVAVFEAPSGVPMGEAFVSRPLGARAAIRLLKRLARAVSPLHESGQAHGALGERTVVVDDELNPTVLVSGLGPVEGSPTPRDDVMAIVELVAAAVRAPAPADSGVSAAARLIAALLGGQAAGRAGATLGLEPGDPGDGDELYRLADALELALLKAGR